jgi:hypothetical protein
MSVLLSFMQFCLVFVLFNVVWAASTGPVGDWTMSGVPPLALLQANCFTNASTLVMFQFQQQGDFLLLFSSIYFPGGASTSISSSGSLYGSWSPMGSDLVQLGLDLSSFYCTTTSNVTYPCSTLLPILYQQTSGIWRYSTSAGYLLLSPETAGSTLPWSTSVLLLNGQN